MITTNSVFKNWNQVPFTKVKIEDSFWRPRMDILKSVTLPVCLVKCEETGRIANFAKAGGLMEGEFEGIYFNDSDVYKVIEGVAYSLSNEKDPILETEVDRIIDFIAAAQEEDGYLNTYYTLKEPDKKWMDMEKHEMYCVGHLIEAAVAYYEATDKTKLLDVACRLANHIDHLFGPGKRHWVEGHEEIELALIKLYRVTGENKYWQLAFWLLEERGRGHGVGAIWDKKEWGPAYCQDDMLVKDIKKVTGHAVRAMYLYTAMADVVHVSANTDYMEALEHVWSHTVESNMYITGGIGPSKHNEGFTHDYDLPNESAYCETCAAIAMVYWNHRMNLLSGESKYADIVEREMYNGALSGLSLSGDKFFYVNPLASKGDHHRSEWFDCSCCPTNIARFIPSIGNYAYAVSEEGLIVNQYMNSTCEVKVGKSITSVRLTQKTEYPWHGNVALTVDPEKQESFSILLRVPSWCKSYQLSVNGKPVSVTTDKGYLDVKRTWLQGDTIVLRLNMPVQVVRARQEVEANRGRLAVQRGPIIYCVEQADNPEIAYDTFAYSASEPMCLEYHSDLLGGVNVLIGKEEDGKKCTFIPYYAWDNREPGFMQVWIPEAVDDSLYKS
jgi:DUF1680 family protein